MELYSSWQQQQLAAAPAPAAPAPAGGFTCTYAVRMVALPCIIMADVQRLGVHRRAVCRSMLGKGTAPGMASKSADGGGGGRCHAVCYRTPLCIQFGVGECEVGQHSRQCDCQLL
jgi:hypothetical protein